jgi:hypothetical protein
MKVRKRMKRKPNSITTNPADSPTISGEVKGKELRKEVRELRNPCNPSTNFTAIIIDPKTNNIAAIIDFIPVTIYIIPLLKFLSRESETK